MTTYRVLEDVSGTVNVSHLGPVDFEFAAGTVTVDGGTDEAAALESLAASGLAELADEAPAPKRGRGRPTIPDADSGDATTEV